MKTRRSRLASRWTKERQEADEDQKKKTESVAARVASHPFLAGMSRTQRALLTDYAMTAQFKPGEIILREGAFANHFYLIESGKVVLESAEGFGEPVIIERIGPGGLLGWSWMVPPYVWHFTARAVEPTEAIFFDGMILRQLCDKNRSLGYELLKRMAPVMLRRLQTARKKMLSIHAHGKKLEPVAGVVPVHGTEV